MSRPAALSLVESLDRQTLGDRAYAQLSELLISGRMAPGEKLSLRQTAEVLGVSIMPVREAVSRLVADGALEVTPNRAVRVGVMTAAQFRDLTQARVAIEGHTAALAARNWRRTAVLLAALTLLGLQMVHNLRLRRVRAGGGGAELGGDHFQARVDHHPSPLRAATGRHRLDQADPGGGGRL